VPESDEKGIALNATWGPFSARTVAACARSKIETTSKAPTTRQLRRIWRLFITASVLDPAIDVKKITVGLKENGFYEKEIGRRTEQLGNIAHDWSIYESRHNENDPEPFMRGINSIQLFNDGKTLVGREHLLGAGVWLIV
jgi:hypothetical protein